MSDTNKHAASRVNRDESTAGWLDLVHDQVASIRFGTVLITVHEGRVVQVEKNEKLRLDNPAPAALKSDQRG